MLTLSPSRLTDGKTSICARERARLVCLFPDGIPLDWPTIERLVHAHVDVLWWAAQIMTPEQRAEFVRWDCERQGRALPAPDVVAETSRDWRAWWVLHTGFTVADALDDARWVYEHVPLEQIAGTAEAASETPAASA